MYSCLLCGVGGQGTVLASRLMAQAAMEKGYFARTAETIGMAQRGGCVVSHVRVAEGDIASSLIPVGGADVLVGFEPGEAVRCLKYLKPDGLAVVCKTPVAPVMASLKGDEYDADVMMEYLKANDKSFLIPQDFDYLRRGGRLTPAAAKVGSLLRLVPLMTQTADDRQLEKAGLCRSFAKAVEKCIETFHKLGVGEKHMIMISHAMNLTEANQAKEMLAKEFPYSRIDVVDLTPAFTTQGGPRCVAIQSMIDIEK